MAVILKNQSKKKLKNEAIICDLSALQFQQFENSGRHVLISLGKPFPIGKLDEEIFYYTVGEKKPSSTIAREDKTQRFLPGFFNNEPILFDTKAYQSFVMQDFLLAAITCNKQAKISLPKLQVNFKFLKYGTGFFLKGLKGEAKEKFEENLIQGVLKGLECFFKLPAYDRRQIQRIELPYFNNTKNKAVKETLAKIERLCDANLIEFSATTTDALAPTSVKYKTATTNCADPHSPMGNEMNYKSVDAAIASNLEMKGYNFNPVSNPKIDERFVFVNHLQGLSTGLPLPKYRKNSLLYYLGMGSLSSALGLGIRKVFSMTLRRALLLSANIFVLMELGQYLRGQFKLSSYTLYKTKTAIDLRNAPIQDLKAFDNGVHSSYQIVPFVKSFFALENYSRGYYAGLEARERNDQSLIKAVKNRLMRKG